MGPASPRASNMKSVVSLLFFLFALPVVWAGPSLSVDVGLNDRLAAELGGSGLNEEPASLGMTLPLHSLVAGPAYDKSNHTEALLSIHFRREDLTSEFELSFFDPGNRDIRLLHPFAARGLEAILTGNELILLVHSGVMLHLRNDVPGSPSFRTFRSDSVVGVVRLIAGEFLISRDRNTIREKLSHLWTRNRMRQRCDAQSDCVRTPDGGITGSIGESDRPPLFPPRVIDR